MADCSDVLLLNLLLKPMLCYSYYQTKTASCIKSRKTPS